MARLASVKLTLFLLLLLAVGALVQSTSFPPSLTVAPTLGLLVLNLLCALLINRRIRGNLPLLGMHLSLLVLLLLLLGARLTYFDGQTSVNVGAEFDGRVFGVEAGPLHRFSAGKIRFSNDELIEQRAAGDRYVAATNRVSWRTAAGDPRQFALTDGQPLSLAGYRIHLTPSRGYAPLFAWAGKDGDVTLGTVQLPDPGATRSFKSPRRTAAAPSAFAEAEEWRLPTGKSAWVMLEREQSAGPGTLHGESFPHRLVIHLDERRWLLAPGQSITVDEGTLSYLRLTSWVGYRIVYDAFTTWIFAACLMAIVFMAGFYWRRLASSSTVASAQC